MISPWQAPTPGRMAGVANPGHPPRPAWWGRRFVCNMVRFSSPPPPLWCGALVGLLVGTSPWSAVRTPWYGSPPSPPVVWWSGVSVGLDFFMV